MSTNTHYGSISSYNTALSECQLSDLTPTSIASRPRGQNIVGSEDMRASDDQPLIVDTLMSDDEMSDKAALEHCIESISELVAATQVVKRVKDRSRKMQLKVAVVFIISMIVLPLCLLAASIFRYSFTSFIYFVFLLALPFIESPVTCSLRGNHCLVFSIILTIMSGAAVGGQIFLEILVAANVVNLETDLKACSPAESRLRQMGFVSFQYPGVAALDVVRLFLPDFCVCAASALLLILIRCLLPTDGARASRQNSIRQSTATQQQPLISNSRRTRTPSSADRESSATPVPGIPKKADSSSLAEFGIMLVKFLNFLLVLACATAAPSLLTSPYILLAFAMGTLWAFRRPVDPGETPALKLVTFAYLIFHMTVLYLYQLPFIRTRLAPESFASRLTGFIAITDTNCVPPPSQLLLEDNLGYPEIALPIYLFVTYIVMAIRNKARNYYFSVKSKHSGKERSKSQSVVDAAPSTSVAVARTSKNHQQQRVPSPLVEETEETMQLLPSDTPALSVTPRLTTPAQSGVTPDAGDGSSNRAFHFLPFIPDAATKIFRRGESAFLPPMSPPRPQFKLSPLDTVYSLFSAYAYVFSLLSMMIWSVTHFSILTFVLLVGACILWMVPNSRQACVVMSPLIVLYAKILISIEFVYGIDLTEAELKSYGEIGLVRYGDTHPGMLAMELLYLLPYWLLLRQRVDRYLASGNLNMPMTTSADTAGAVSKAIQMLLVTTAISERKTAPGLPELNRFVLKIIKFFLDQISVYWIFLCFIMILVQACTGQTTIINFVYMLIFMITTFFFILSFRIWRRLLFTTCWFLCLYSMTVLLSIYIYQFDAVETWLDVNSTSELWRDLGLNKYDTAPALFNALILPAVSLMVLVLQLQFFHEKLLQRTECVAVKHRTAAPQGGEDDVSSTAETVTSHDHGIDADVADGPLIDADWWRKLVCCFSTISQYTWRLLEVHMFKVVIIFAASLAIVEPTAVNMPMLLAAVILLPLISRYTNTGPTIVSAIVYLGVCLAVIFKMGYQLNMVKHYRYIFETNCTVYDPAKNVTEVVEQSLVDWIGLEESDNMLIYLQLYIILIVLFLVQQLVYVRQSVYFCTNSCQRPPYGVVFPHITRKEADRSVMDLLMYFVNYGFYKFGLEITWVSTTIVIATRLDSFSLIYAIPLVIQLWMPRKICARFYPVFILVLVILLVAQYSSCVGFPFYFTCGEYPWENLDQQLRLWLMLPSTAPGSTFNCSKLIGDFVQLLLASLQLCVFRIEAQQGPSYAGGDNSDALPSIELYYNNPVHDFISEKKSLLDELKSVTFELMFWVTILVLFFAGVGDVNVFSLIYLIVCFILLWYGQSLLIKPIDQLIKTWHIILALNVFVIIVKAGLQLLACMETGPNFLPMGDQTSCDLRQVFDLVCVSPSLRDTAPRYTCKSLAASSSPLGADIAAFVFLLIMKRLYRSYYFQHVVRDFDIQSSLASLGASLIMHRQQEQLKREREAELKRVDKIKSKIERIRQRQNATLAQMREKMQSGSGIPIETSDIGLLQNETDHYRVVRGGDYYMFEERDSDEEDPAALLLGSNPRGQSQTAGKIEKTPLDVIADTVLKKGPSAGATSSLSQLPRVVSASMSSAGPAPSPAPDAIVELHTTVEEDGAQSSSLDLHGQDGARQRRFRTTSGSSSAQVHPPQIAVEGDVISEVAPASDADTDDEDEDEELPQTTTWKDAVKNAGRFIYELFYSSLTSLINLLNSLTFEHYLVRRRLKRQTEIQKISSRRQGIVPGEVTRARSGHRKQGSTASAVSVGGALVTSGPVPTLSVPAISGAAGASIAKQATSSLTGEPIFFPTFVPEELTEEEEVKEREEIETELRNHSLAYRLIRAVFDLFLARTEYVCYFLMVLTFLLEGSILSLPLPLFAFAWGMLAIPNPGQRFWITVMTYEMLVVVVKFIFQFPLGIESNEPTGSQTTGQEAWNSYNDVARLFGVTRRQNFAILDILLLVALFLHRFMLKRFGLWKPAELPVSESKTDSLPASSPQPEERPKSAKKSAKLLETNEKHFSVASFDSTDQSTLIESGNQDPIEIVDYIDADLESSDSDLMNSTGCCTVFCNRIRSVPGLIALFFIQLTNAADRSPRDLYAFTFAADFCALLTTVFAYDKFGPASQVGEAQAVFDLLQSDAVPIPFVILLLVQFSFLLIDRALYIRKLAVGKLIFQFILLILVHVVTLFILPLPTVTNIPFSQNAAVQVWYFFKCAYFAFSAYQIKFGYPQHVSTHFLTKQYNYLMWLLLKGYMVIPFLLELRTIMDWVFTRTTLSWRYWLITDLCYYEIFSIKCERRMEEKYPTIRGVPRRWILKIHGLLFLAGIVFILWFPFLLFSFGDLMVMPAEMMHFQVSMKLSGTPQAIFSYAVDTESGGLYQMSEEKYDKLFKCFSEQNQQLQYTSKDVWLARIGNNSQSLWTLSPPALEALENSLKPEVKNNMSISAIFTVRRNTPKSRNAPSIQPWFQVRSVLEPVTRESLLTILDNVNATNKVMFDNMIPQYLIVDRAGSMDSFKLPKCQNEKAESLYFNASMSLLRQSTDERWWESTFDRSSTTCDCELNLEKGNQTEIMIVSAPVKAEVLSLLDRLGTSIIGVYTAVVLVVHRLLRSSMIEGANYRVMFTELPRCDRVWRLLNEIYIVRQFGEWMLEEELVARLIFLYRSPQTMIDQTRQVGLI